MLILFKLFAHEPAYYRRLYIVSNVFDLALKSRSIELSEVSKCNEIIPIFFTVLLEVFKSRHNYLQIHLRLAL